MQTDYLFEQAIETNQPVSAIDFWEQAQTSWLAKD
jgi:hypothetical protein